MWNALCIPLNFADKSNQRRRISHLVERPDAPRRRVREEAAVQHHGPAQQVEAEEHGQRQHDLQLCLRQRQACRGVLEGLLEVRQQPHRIRVDGHRRQLQGHQGHAVGRHGNPPILGPDVVHVELVERRWLDLTACA